MPLPRSLANFKREISEKKGVERRRWAGGRTSKKKYRLPKSQRPDRTVAGSTKRLASRFYQLKAGHCLTGQYLNWTKNRSTPQCWWCRYQTQIRDYLFMECILWAEVKKETGRWKTGRRCGTFWPTGGAAGRSLTSYPRRMWEGGCRLRQRTTR